MQPPRFAFDRHGTAALDDRLPVRMLDRLGLLKAPHNGPAAASVPKVPKSPTHIGPAAPRVPAWFSTRWISSGASRSRSGRSPLATATFRASTDHSFPYRPLATGSLECAISPSHAVPTDRKPRMSQSANAGYWSAVILCEALGQLVGEGHPDADGHRRRAVLAALPTLDDPMAVGALHNPGVV